MIMDAADYGEFSDIDLEQFLMKSSLIQCRAVGTISTIFKHKVYNQYMIEIYNRGLPEP